MGRRDNGVSLNDALVHLRSMARSVDVPVNADFEGGFAIEPASVGANVAEAAATGIAGLSIEDSTRDAAHPLFEPTLAVERSAARQIDVSQPGVVLTA
jgi:methylisocitrate lyase